MLSLRSHRPTSPAQQLSARPVRLAMGEMSAVREGAWRLTVPLRTARWAVWLLRLPPEANKTFEFDDLGHFVWSACNGKTSVKQVIRRLARRYDLGERQAEVSTLKFLRMLASRGLIAVEVDRKPASRKAQRA